MSNKIWKYLLSQKEAHSLFAVAETHVSRKGLRKWDKLARGEGLRLHANPAREDHQFRTVAASQEARANESGEWIVSRGHLQVRSFETLCSTQVIRAGEGRVLDGMMPVVVHMAGYTFVLVCFYGINSMGFTGPNLLRYQRLGAFLHALQLPWVVVGDFNVPAAAVTKSEFAARVGGH
eukprot:7990857-Pyramimonas_sp.AAC.1